LAEPAEGDDSECRLLGCYVAGLLCLEFAHQSLSNSATLQRSNHRSRINPIQHSRIRNRFSEMRDPADPGHAAFDAHAEAGVGEGAIFADIEVPLELLDGEVVLLDSLEQQVVIMDALRAADDLAIAFGGNHVQA